MSASTVTCASFCHNARVVSTTFLAVEAFRVIHVPCTWEMPSANTLYDWHLTPLTRTSWTFALVPSVQSPRGATISYTGCAVVVKDGRFGPYVTDGSVNASLRKDDSVEAIDLDRAVELLRERRAKLEGQGKKIKPCKKVESA